MKERLLDEGQLMNTVQHGQGDTEFLLRVIGENGGIAKLRPAGRLLDLGYSREPALKDLERLKQFVPR
jgi:hypothetical protein